MKILVLSDTHGFIDNAKDILNKIGDKIDVVIHLGDFVNDALRLKKIFPEHKFYFVSGNNDYNEDAPEHMEITISGKKILITHGHKLKVHWGMERIYFWAESKEASIVLFGHTHYPYLNNEGKCAFFNPGSVSFPRRDSTPTFGIIDITHEKPAEFAIMAFLGKDKLCRIN